MVNVNKLKGKIVENGLTVEKLAEQIGMDRSTLYRKLNNAGETFTIREANLICRVLNLTGTEATAIFFSNYVA
jgi:transcriptional regulator with XRE-family HTH domain